MSLCSSTVRQARSEAPSQLRTTRHARDQSLTARVSCILFQIQNQRVAIDDLDVTGNVHRRQGIVPGNHDTLHI